MKRRPVRAVPEVEDAILRQVNYIAEDSIDHALAWEKRLRAAMKALAGFHGHAIDEVGSKTLGYPVRRFVFESTYLIFYQVDTVAEEVRVVSFRHGARLPLADEP